MAASNEVIDNTLTEAVIYLNEPQLNVHRVHEWVSNKYPEFVEKLGEEKHAKQRMSYGLRRLAKKGMLKNIGKTHGSIVYEYLHYDRTPDRGEDKPFVLARPAVTPIQLVDQLNQPTSATTPAMDYDHIINRLFEQNEKLLETIVNLTK